MMTPYPHQEVGADFLASKTAAILADEPRVGKTGTAITAAEKIGAKNILVVTTASGRAVWKEGLEEWAPHREDEPAVYYGGKLTNFMMAADRLIIGWAAVDKLADQLAARRWDVLIVDESHYAKDWSAKRTKALYHRLVNAADRVWCLTGTPIPNSPLDLHPCMSTLTPEALKDDILMEWPNTIRFPVFKTRYCETRMRNFGGKPCEVVVGGKNLEELHDRLDGIMLRRTQQDVGITKPSTSILPIHITQRDRRMFEADFPELADVLASEDLDDADEQSLAALRRATGTLKAKGVAETVKDDLNSGIDKIVVMAWHHDVMDQLEKLLGRLGVVRVDGSTTPQQRERRIREFQTNDKCRIFLGQIVACGEAVDLSRSAELIFAESSFVPKDMIQASLRITNHNQPRAPRVRIAALEGTIDRIIQGILVRKTSVITEVLK